MRPAPDNTAKFFVPSPEGLSVPPQNVHQLVLQTPEGSNSPDDRGNFFENWDDAVTTALDFCQNLKDQAILDMRRADRSKPAEAELYSRRERQLAIAEAGLRLLTAKRYELAWGLDPGTLAAEAVGVWQDITDCHQVDVSPGSSLHDCIVSKLTPLAQGFAIDCYRESNGFVFTLSKTKYGQLLARGHVVPTEIR